MVPIDAQGVVVVVVVVADLVVVMVVVVEVGFESVSKAVGGSNRFVIRAWRSL